MARNTTLTVAANTWTQLTANDVQAITFQVEGNARAYIKGTTGTTAPTDLLGSARYSPGQGELNVALSELFPGINAVRVWVFAESNMAVFVSHA